MTLRIPIFVKIITPLVALILVTTIVSGVLVYREAVCLLYTSRCV